MGNVILYFFFRFLGVAQEEKEILHLPPGLPSLRAYVRERFTWFGYKNEAMKSLISERLWKFREARKYHFTPGVSEFSMTLVDRIFIYLHIEYIRFSPERDGCPLTNYEPLFYIVRTLYQNFWDTKERNQTAKFKERFNRTLRFLRVTPESHPHEIDCVFDILRYCTNLLYLADTFIEDHHLLPQWLTELHLDYPWVKVYKRRRRLNFYSEVTHFYECKVCRRLKCDKCLRDIFQFSKPSFTVKQQYRLHCCGEFAQIDLR